MAKREKMRPSAGGNASAGHIDARMKANSRAGSLFGANPGSVTVAEGVDLTEPVFCDEIDAETGAEIRR